MIRSLPFAVAAFSLLGGTMLRTTAQTPDVKATLTDETPAATRKNPGDVIDYRVTVTNAATATANANNPIVNLPTPAGTTIVPGSVNMSPIVYDESYNALPNTRLVIDLSHGVTWNDADDKGILTVVNVTRLDGTGTTNASPGTLSAAGNGDFTYTPGLGATGSERFQYYLRDSDNVLSFSPGIVTFNLTGPRIWFVQAGAAAGGTGQSHSPFNTPEAASTAAIGTDMIYVLGSGSALNGSFTLEDGQELRGQGLALTVATSHPSYQFANPPTTVIFPAATAPVLTNTNAGGDIVSLTGNSGTKTIAGVNLGNRSGSAISGSGFGTLTVGNAVSTSGSGQVLALNTGTIGGTFASLSTTSAVTAVSLSTVTGTLSATAVSMSGVTGDLFNINGGTVTLGLPPDYTFSGTTGRSLNISNRGVGGNLTFNNKIINSGAGILLDNNDAATITFRSLNLTTAANTAFSAINGGTVVVTNGLTDNFDNDGDGNTDEADESNTITTTTGTALNIASTSIGAGGVTFRSISAGTAASGPANGIVLNNTGSSGGLTVTGDGGGSNNGSGGTIQRTSGAGVSLSSTSSVSLNHMNIQDAGDDGISGTSVAGFVLNRANVTNNGNALNEDGVDFGGSGVTTPSGLFGSVNVTNSVFTGNYYNQFTVRNSSGSVGLAITGSTFNGRSAENNNNDGLFLEALSNATITANAQTSNFAANKGDHFQAAASNSGNLNVTFKSNTLAGGHSSALGQGIVINAATGLAFGGYTGTVNYDIDGNTINGSILSAITVNLGTSNPPALFNGFIRNNVIGTTGSLYSGSTQGNGISWDAHGKGTHTSSVANNIVRESFDRGMAVLVNDGSPVANLTITGNNLRPTANDANGSREAIEFNLASTSANVFGEVDAPTVRVNLSSNTLVGGAFKNGDIRMRQRLGSRVEMPSYGGSPFNTANVISYLQGNNSGTIATATANDHASFSNDGYFSGTVTAPGTVPQPLLFAASETASLEPVDLQLSDAAAAIEPVAVPTAEVINAPTSSSEIEPLTQTELDRMVALARERWDTAGLSQEQEAALDGLTFEVANLPGWHLGEASAKKVRVDSDAGGHGWFVDRTPGEDSEFTKEGEKLMAIVGTDARSEVTHRVDLLTTLLHEMGHTIGLCDSYADEQRSSVMYGFLTKGERRLPTKSEAADAVPHEHETPHFLEAPLGMPQGYTNLPPGKGFRIYYQVTVNNPLTAAPITSQGTVTGDNFATVTTDDVVNDTDAPAGAADPTVTLIDRPDATVVSLNRVSGNPRNAPTVTWQIVFSQPVSNLTNTNFSLVNTGLGGSPTIGSVTETSGPPSTTWNITASTGSGDGTLGLNLVNDTGLFHDVTNAPFPGEIYTIDKTPPTVAFSSAAANTTNVSPIPVTLTFNESVTGFTADDITPGNATVANFGGSGTTYTFDLVPAGEGSVTADIAASVAQDEAGNSNIAATQFSRTYDSTVPTVAMTSATGNPAANAAIPVSVTFSESVTGFIAADITPGNATVANFGGTGASYTFDLVPSGPGVTATADIAGGVAQDVAGNLNTPATQFSRTILDAVSIAATTATAVEGGATGVYTFTRGASSGEVTVNFQLDASSTALAGTDFTLSSSQTLSFNDDTGAGTLVIPDGSLTATITLTALMESLNAAEVAETARLNITSGTGYVPASGPGNNATVTISANGFVVVNTNDSGEGSLRQAVVNANTIAGADTITFAGPTFSDATEPDIIDLASMLPSLSGQIRIVGPGAAKLVVRRPAAAGPYSLMQLFPGTNASLSGLTFSGGDGGIANLGTLRLEDCAVSGNSSSFSGGILNNGTLVVLNSTISGNSSTSGVGGGIYCVAGSSLTIVNSTLSGNTSQNGGAAIAIVSGSTVVISNSTISGNTAGSSGAGISNSGALTVINSTITGNSSVGQGGGIASFGGGSLTLRNSIVAGNTATGGGADIQMFGAGNLLVSNGANFIGSATGANGIAVTDKTFASTSTTLSNVLNPLANNGGPSQTHSLPGGSPAINGGTNADIAADTFDLDGDLNTTEPIPFDQRGTGFVRAVGSVDIGAFELQKSVFIVADTASKNEGNGGTNNFGFTVTRTGGTTGEVSMTYTVGGGVVNGADFVGSSLPTGTTTIADGETSTTVNIAVQGDTIREADESFTVTLTDPDHDYVVSGAPAAATITNDDFEADLSITKTDGVTTAIPGSSVTYTITASNAGPDPVIGATVADTFPASLTATWTAVGAGGGTATASGSGNINDVVNLPVGASVTYTMTAAISPAATGSLTNTATVSSTVTDPSPANNSATDTDTLTPQADLAITKTDGVTTAIPGGSVTYTITASNAGPSNVTATVADTFPASLTATWTAVGAGGGTATASGSGNINDTVNLPAGGSVTYTVTATISPSATGTLTNTATVSSMATDPTPGNNSATDTDTLTPQADLTITKTDGVTSAIPGGSVTYTITATNAGPSNATGATIADTLPASLTATWTAVGAGGGTATASGSGNISDTVNLPVGGSVTYTVSATISASATGTLSNTATATAPAGVTDPTPGNNSATDSDTLTPRANLSITKTDGVTTAIPGGSVTYTITATNAGPSSVTGATVADTLPASLAATWTAVGAGGGTATASGSGNINDTVNLPVGASVTYTVSATIASSATGTLSNTATVTAPASVTDPTPADNSATDTDTLNAQADLSITKTDGATTAIPGGSVTYTITASNAGPSNASAVSVSDVLPASISGATWTGIGAGGGTGPASGSGNISASNINLPAGGSFTFTVTAPVSAAATGTLVNTATVSSAVTDPNPANNSATDTDTLTPQADLTITKTDGVTSAVPGTPVTYTITASNAGPSNAPGATVADTLPVTLTGVTWTAVGAGGGTATASGSGNINDTVSLPAGGSVTYTVTGTISSTTTGTLANTATVAVPAGVTDTNPANNSATDTDTLTPQANLALTMTDSPDPVNALGNLTYSIGLTNNGPSASASPLVTLPLPAGTTFVSASAPAGWTPSTPAVGATGTVTFSAVSIATGGTANFTVVAKVNIDIVNDSILTATATASSATADPTPGNNTATTTTLAKSGADLELTLTDSPNPVNAGTNLTYTIGVTNHGPLDADNVLIGQDLPTGTTFVSLSTPAGWSATTPPVGSAGSVAITRSSFANAASATFTLVVKVAPNVASGAGLLGFATVNSTTVDIVANNNRGIIFTTVSTQADLAVAIVATPTTAPKESDVTFSVGLSNQGPSDAASPVVTLPLPANMTFVSAVAPAGWTTNAPSVGATGTVTFSATTLATGGTGDFTIVAKVNSNTPTGTVLTATVTTSSSAGDTQTANNSATATVAVGTVLPTVVQPVTTGFTANPQSGLFEVNVNVTNTTPNPINGFRLHVDYASYKAAFPSLRLYNASSPANAQDVYVDYPFPVAVDGVITMKLSFYTSTRTFPSPFTPQLTVEILPSSQLPGTNGAGVQPRVVGFPNGNLLLEFPSVTGNWYRVRYSSDLVNWHDCPVPLQAGSTRMQWIDSGPPFTDVPPSQAPARYYRVNEIAAP